MHAALYGLFAADQISVAVIDVDAYPALLEKFDELVPVLIGHRENGSSSQLCHYFLDVECVKAFVLEETRHTQFNEAPQVAHLSE